MITAFAKLEGIELTPHLNVQLCKSNKGEVYIGGAYHTKYNPLTDHALAFKAMVEYGVTVDFRERWVRREGESFESVIDIDAQNSLSSAIIKVILESEGLWHE